MYRTKSGFLISYLGKKVLKSNKVAWRANIEKKTILRNLFETCWNLEAEAEF